MKPSKETILSEAMHLSPSDRLDLADRLFQSAQAQFSDDVAVDWSNELQQRVRALDEGRVQSVPMSVVREKLRTLLDRG